jgi:hypothetical protein
MSVCTIVYVRVRVWRFYVYECRRGHTEECKGRRRRTDTVDA